MPIKKAKEQEDELWNEIYKMKKRTSEKKIGKKFSIKNKKIIFNLIKVGNELYDYFSIKNKKIIFNLIKVGNELYDIRDEIIGAFEKKNSRAKF